MEKLCHAGIQGKSIPDSKKKKKAHEKALLWNMAGKLEVKQAGEGWWSRVESRG